MDVKLKIIAGGYFFVFLCVYASHNFLHEMYKNINNMDTEKFAIMDFVFIFKFFGASYFSNLADRTMKHTQILLGCIVGYLIFFFCSLNGSKIIKSKICNLLVTIFFRTLSVFFLSGVFPILDVICLNYLEDINKVQAYYGRVRMASCAGHSLGALSARFGDIIATDVQKKSMPLYFTCLFGLFCLLFVWITFDLFKTKKKVNENKSTKTFGRRFRRNMISIKGLMSINISLLLVAIILQGIYRQALTNYLESYLKDNNIPRDKSAVIFAIRCLPEAAMLYITPHIDRAIGIYWMFFLSILFGIARPLFYGMKLVSKDESLKTVIQIYFLECSKGIFSALFGYSASKIMKELASPETRSLAQGLYNGCYSGLAPFLSAIICYIFFRNEIQIMNKTIFETVFFVMGMMGAAGLIFAVLLIFRQKMKIGIIPN